MTSIMSSLCQDISSHTETFDLMTLTLLPSPWLGHWCFTYTLFLLNKYLFIAHQTYCRKLQFLKCFTNTNNVV